MFNIIFPNQCPGCSEIVQDTQAICATCWRDTYFIRGCCCDACGIDLPGDEARRDIFCDDCMNDPKPWSAGRAALMYQGTGRQMILGLKHGDRHDLIKPLAKWMASSAAPIVPADPIIVPIPLHWKRMLRRKYNQSALLARQISKELGISCSLDGLQRKIHTSILDGLTREQRFEKLAGSMRVPDKKVKLLRGRNVILVDDVMTTGATLKEATRVLQLVNVASVNVLTLARAGKAA